MADEQALGSESVGLDIDIGSGDAAQETRFADIRVSANQESAGSRINRGKPTKMLADLIEV